ncbi:MAG TPA: family 10 glycosylhydrolase [Candidatus Avipropionibacterium avicola]|uniref:Family 10 glycosylhydrolase n=1 Tax=Candidatus Avipropionibacterium avicola TaxID=2840701 RepID=A0A9D1GZL5_9ACTN|nr:family 10 glycosylhydrolase [Candidatus Avipropionibacterium avicola]
MTSTPGPIDRRTLLRMSGGAVVGGAFAAGLTTLPAHADTDQDRPKRQFRAMWISSVVNIDWPSKTGLSVEEQQEEFVAWLDLARELNLNAVISQVRPTADAFWPSEHEPWSQYLTGTQGEDPGYDPLAFQLAEARKRNLEYHAWFNPYRVSMSEDPDQLVADHPGRLHPEWVFGYGGKLYYNPGIPEVREFVQDAMLDAVARYDIDGVHFDDYFYPYPVDDLDYPDADTYQEYGRGIDSIEDWRRDNINLLVKEMGERIHDLKPWVKFGISPFGIWRNASSDPLGSQTSGTESYDAISADSRTWVKQGWVDYINPQIYWQIGLDVADYAALVPWWADVVADTDVSLYIGQAAYKVTSGVFTDPKELSQHLTFNQDYPQVDGDVWFSAKDVRDDELDAISLMAERHYSRPALSPLMKHLGGRAPQAPVAMTARRISGGIQVQWGHRGAVTPASYAIWRLKGRRLPTADDLADATCLVATVRASGARPERWVDTTAASGKDYTYVVTAYDRLGHESEMSRALYA